jgi:hypothetical protein
MSRLRFSACAVGVVTLMSVLAAPGTSWAGGPGVWTKLATVGNVGDTFGMARTPNGDLHLVWLKKPTSSDGYGTSTISPAGKLLATGTALSGWQTLEQDPQLVRSGSGLRLIFEGNKGSSGCFFDAEVFTATSANGTAWSLVNGSMDHETAGVGNLAATVESDGITPVATFASGGLFHVGVDPSCPALVPDGTVKVAAGNSPSNPTIVTASDGSVWVATFQAFAKEGYFVTRILPSAGPLLQAPSSKPPPAHNNQPLEPVALAARTGGGVYMAYCVANSSQPCVHIDLWKVGTPKPMTVPGSANTCNGRLALAAAPGGRLAITWFNAPKCVEDQGVIHSVRTNTNATSFGIVRTVKPPPHLSGFNDIQTQDSTGRLDVLINDQLSTGTSPIDLFHTQILPGLSLRASPTSFSHKHAATVTFTVTDAGQAVAGAKVACLGKSAATSASGQAKLDFAKGAAVGKHSCTASRAGYAPGKTKLKVT